MIKTYLFKLRTKLRKASPKVIPLAWNERDYLVANPDVKAAIDTGLVSSGFEHWQRKGHFEGRRLRPNSAKWTKDAKNDALAVSDSQWDEAHYLSQNPDVKAAVENGTFSSGLEHWQRHGRFEGRRLAPIVPNWLRREMLSLSDIEPKLFPSQAFCSMLADYCPVKNNRAGQALVELLKKVGEKSFTHVFLLPWLKAGGADLESLHHIKVLSGHFGARILVIFTEDSDSPWLPRLPKSIITLPFGRVTAGIDPLSAQIILARMLLKLKPAIIHNVNSALGWQIYGRYGLALRSESRLYASVFCFDYTLEGEPVGYARELEKACPHLEGIFCDNQAFATRLTELYGIKASLFLVMRYPVRGVPRFKYAPDDRPKILWAGRLDRQKRPDILKKIASALPNCIFHVYGSRLLDTPSKISQAHDGLSELSNVTFFGRYDSFNTIPKDNYALFLYTTQWDGMPNVILEALASGIAVLAPDVGGIAEVIPPDSGFLIPRFDDVESYVSAIRRLTANPQLILDERDKRLRSMRDKHSDQQFIASLASLAPYSLTDLYAIHDRRESSIAKSPNFSGENIREGLEQKTGSLIALTSPESKITGPIR